MVIVVLYFWYKETLSDEGFTGEELIYFYPEIFLSFFFLF